VSSAKSSQFWIVTPTYNQADFIRQTIESVLNQAGAKIKVKYFVADGNSSDATVKILKSFGDTLSWVSQKDRGQTDAINKGFKQLLKKNSLKKSDSNQVIIAYINSDDYYLPQTFLKVAAEFEAQPQAEWLVGECLIIDEKNKRIQPLVQLYKKCLRALKLSWVLAITNPIPQPAVFMRLSAFQKVGFFNEQLRYVMDYEYWWRLLITGGQPIVSTEVLAAFRIHSASKGGSQFQRQFAEEYQVATQFIHNPLLLFCHRLHTLMIVTIYRLIK